MPSKTEDLWWLFTRQTVKVTSRESVLTAARIMQRRNFRHLPVVDENEKILGMISAQDVIDSLNFVLSEPGRRSRQVLESLEIPVERIMVYNSICVEPGDGLAEITKKMTFHNLGGMPVVDEQGKVRGIITLRDFVGLMGVSSDPVGIQVSELMNTKLVTVKTGSLLSEAVALMSEHRVRRLPVVAPRSDGRKLDAIFSSKDAIRHLVKVGEGAGPESEFDTPISDYMTKEVMTVSQDDDIRTAASKMMIFGIGGLMVDDTEDGRLALITERDLVRTLSSKRGNGVLMAALQFEREVENSRQVHAAPVSK